MPTLSSISDVVMQPVREWRRTKQRPFDGITWPPSRDMLTRNSTSQVIMHVVMKIVRESQRIKLRPLNGFSKPPSRGMQKHNTTSLFVMNMGMDWRWI